MDSIQTKPGRPMKLGTLVTPQGVYFTVFSRNAKKIFLELYNSAEDAVPYHTVELNPETNRTGDLWHVFVEGLKPGDLYLYRVDGPFAPSKGHRFDKNQSLFDPRAKAFTEGSVFKYMLPGKDKYMERFPKCVIVNDDDYDWEDDKPLAIPLEKSIIYEMHLKGFTASPSSEVEHPGTYRGLIEKIPYLQSLGISAVELLPVMEFDEYENTNVNPRTGARMKNYWGYSTIGFFAPKYSYSSDKTPGGCVREFKDMVKALHSVGIEVILDVVFNHTAEGNENGISLNFRGFDNKIFYHLVPDHKEYYMNFSGCGNAVNANHPVVQDFIIDCLHYWVLEMHVDGFRFDLASELCRDEKGCICDNAPLTKRIAEDSVLRNTKIIAEPWDCGGGYQIGNFPGGRWCEWNDHYRDGIRRFIRGDEFIANEAATRIAGSNDIYALSGRAPIHSINFITAHDGFTLNDLVTYNHKHNEDNGEGNRDGNDNNISYNYGYEGPTVNPKIENLRSQQIRNFFTMLMISQGVPMFVAGDEVRRTQNGNNNAYCQDNETSWFNWNDVKDNSQMLEFVQKLIALRNQHVVFHRRNFFGGASTSQFNEPPDISWFNFDGTVPDWNKMNRYLGLRLGGKAAGLPTDDNDFFIAINMDIHDMTITVPRPSNGRKWYRAVDTSISNRTAILLSGQEETLNSQEHYVLVANSILVLISK
ncbi:MAG: glycogen debranching protein GlgX [Treponema sp.]|uniref:glycogen debranching protein GlgX n=1 Tax=Treponema sp. TaxID=166 RepID=UPI001B4358F1|nr:glycogen debranching protein GlgX [Treponema sp.]MBP3771662.1 glycogen debranching protein GlgX [Treponema sp.]MBQ9281154.1 glycogen debranching protein GlgX [Treponema sp.]